MSYHNCYKPMITLETTAASNGSEGLMWIPWPQRNGGEEVKPQEWPQATENIAIYEYVSIWGSVNY